MPLDRFVACNHAPALAPIGQDIWRQAAANGPMRARCAGCGKVLKYSSETDVYRRGQR